MKTTANDLMTVTAATSTMGEAIPAPPADFEAGYIARRFISQDIRHGAPAPAWARMDRVIDTGNSERDVAIARRLNAGRR